MQASSNLATRYPPGARDADSDCEHRRAALPLLLFCVWWLYAFAWGRQRSSGQEGIKGSGPKHASAQHFALSIIVCRRGCSFLYHC